ncbi:hypothetical protein BaRGS_00023760 [Batillaria attramentaria]|uniref:Uncharacterized protein n=1 Tax=Batillaria attramentaria TaxID=370345 RepID=A0ABD0KD88_9CAEN
MNKHSLLRHTIKKTQILTKVVLLSRGGDLITGTPRVRPRCTCLEWLSAVNCLSGGPTDDALGDRRGSGQFAARQATGARLAIGHFASLIVSLASRVKLRCTIMHCCTRGSGSETGRCGTAG